MLIVTSVKITKEQKAFLEETGFNFSKFSRENLLNYIDYIKWEACQCQKKK